MKYRIERTESGKYNAVIVNRSFGFETVFTFDTKEDAQYFIEANSEASKERLAEVATISEYFGKVN